jgi:hypothetical protein
VPIKIYTDDEARAEVAWLCDDDWRLPSQVSALQAWLTQNTASLGGLRYIADIGFSPRPDPGGGGASISPEMMRNMAELGITLFLSEYPAMDDGNCESTHKA